MAEYYNSTHLDLTFRNVPGEILDEDDNSNVSKIIEFTNEQSEKI